MAKQIFVITGYIHWGKSHILYDLFNRKRYQPTKSPIPVDWLPGKCFTVINESNEDCPTEEYLDRLKEVLAIHEDNDCIFIITMSLLFDGDRHDVTRIIEYLNSLYDYEVAYLRLDHGWHRGAILHNDDLVKMSSIVEEREIVSFSSEINQSGDCFIARTQLIKDLITIRSQQIQPINQKANVFQ